MPLPDEALHSAQMETLPWAQRWEGLGSLQRVLQWTSRAPQLQKRQSCYDEGNQDARGCSAADRSSV